MLSRDTGYDKRDPRRTCRSDSVLGHGQHGDHVPLVPRWLERWYLEGIKERAAPGHVEGRGGVPGIVMGL